jgi:hypothetical protein
MFFRARKEAEYKLKKITHGDKMSCVPPDQYAGRFRRTMKEYILLAPKSVLSTEFHIQKDSTW